MANLPTRVLEIQDADNWETEASAFADGLEANGERCWFEVRYPAPERLTEQEKAEWLTRQEDTYDAIERVDGVFCTLPPYEELLKGEGK